MSLIIKGIDLPKASNEDCIAVIRSNGKVEVWQTGMKEFEAQAVQIPKNHGRLIDGDALYKFFEDALNKNPLDDWWEAGAVLDNIELAPTILEAEE